MDLENVALLIVDMQNDVVHEKGFRRRYSRQAGIPTDSLDRLRDPIPHIKKLTTGFRQRGKKVIYTYLAFEPDYSDAPPSEAITKAKGQGALVAGSWGAQIIDELAPQAGDHVVKKHTSGAFFQTPLDRLLRNLGVTTLVTTGVATNFCVDTTVREAVAYGYEVILVSDGCASFDMEGHEATLKVVEAGFGHVMSTDEVLKAFSS
jgi:nicotinamidase-related amidase